MKEYDIDVQYNTLQEKIDIMGLLFPPCLQFRCQLNRERWSVHGRETPPKCQESSFPQATILTF